ncbi:MAG TPA: shikimate dehydrogenase [bacterium]|nr:shikimate dehydrogenase [bacterium]
MTSHQPFQLYGIFGDPLAHTLSPAMQEAAFAFRGIKAYYLALEFDRAQFRKLMDRLPKLVLSGFNVTVPYKEEIIPYLDGLTPSAQSVGAVNTVFRRGKKWIGANTDVDGFLMSLSHDAGFDPAGKKALVLGAGGAARAVVMGLSREKARSVWIANRSLSRARKMADDMAARFPKVDIKASDLRDASLKQAFCAADLVVNATSVGLSPKDARLFPASVITKAGKKKQLFFDLIYKPSETAFLKEARKKGHRILNGAGMLLYQGAQAFQIWSRKKAPVPQMRRALAQALNEKESYHA